MLGRATAHGCTRGGEGANEESMSGHWKDGSSELDIGGVGGGFGGGGAGRRSRSGMMLGLQVMTVRAKELVIMSAAVGARGIINGLFEALQSGTHACACAHVHKQHHST